MRNVGSLALDITRVHPTDHAETFGFKKPSSLRRSSETVSCPPAIAASHPDDHSLSVQSVTHMFGSSKALDGVSLQLREGEFASLLGPSGCGKTTLLKIIAGFYRPTAGDVRLHGSLVTDVPVRRRGVGIVFQNYALFPHMTVAQNIAYGLLARRDRADLVKDRVEQMLRLVRLDSLRDRLPAQLSGGQQQRVAIARALAIRPGIMLLDEPFSALDKNLRLDMQIEMKRILKESGVTAILVTHDQEEAMSMSDRIAVMSAGRIHQFDTPGAVYDTPASLFVSSFVGTSNLLRGRILSVSGATMTVEAESAVLDIGAIAGATAGMLVDVVVRPENLSFVSMKTPDAISATVTMVMPFGPTLVYELETSSGARLKLVQQRSAEIVQQSAGDAIYIRPSSSAVCPAFAVAAA